MLLKGRTALVTGGAIRVGKAIALAAAGRGANVAITFRTSAAEADATVSELHARGVRALAVRCDQRDPAQVEAVVREVEAALGPIDLLVNNAGIFRRTPFEDATLEDWDAHLEVNLRGPWLFAKAVAPGMKQHREGVIVNLLDSGVSRPYAAYLPYIVSKGGLETLTHGLARALGPEVRVNGIAIGTVLWPDEYPEDLKRAYIEKTPLKRIGTPEDVARAVLYLTEEAEFVTGAVLPIDGGRRLS